MPELPEVQTLIDTLIEDGVCNKKITGVSVFLKKILKNTNVKEFEKCLIGEKFTKITRVGKYLVFHISNKNIMLVHLRMEGKMFFVSEKENNFKNDKHVHVDIEMGNKHLLYHDTRQFGTFHIYKEDNYLNSSQLKKVGLDPLDKEFDWKYLKENLHSSKRSVKTSLLDQSNVSGIGNIYADEILFASSISPTRLASSITDEEYKLIAKHAKAILEKAIKNKGTTIMTYLFRNNESGSFQKFLKVHLKKGKPCVNCGSEILKDKVNGRGTYYCPKCQK